MRSYIRQKEVNKDTEAVMKYNGDDNIQNIILSLEKLKNGSRSINNVVESINKSSLEMQLNLNSLLSRSNNNHKYLENISQFGENLKILSDRVVQYEKRQDTLLLSYNNRELERQLIVERETNKLLKEKLLKYESCTESLKELEEKVRFEEIKLTKIRSDHEFMKLLLAERRKELHDLIATYRYFNGTLSSLDSKKLKSIENNIKLANEYNEELERKNLEYSEKGDISQSIEKSGVMPRMKKIDPKKRVISYDQIEFYNKPNIISPKAISKDSRNGNSEQ